MKIRRHIRARFSRPRKVLFPVAPGVDRATAHSLGLDLNSGSQTSTPGANTKEEQQSSRTVLENARRERHRSRNYVLSKFFRDSRPYLRPTPAKDAKRNGGQYQLRVMPFGLKNAPRTFLNLMRSVFADQWGKIAIAYLDDIIVFPSGWQEHLLYLSLILEQHEIYGLTCAPKKCSFGQTSLQYLRQVVSAEGNCPQDRHSGAILSN